jgi:prolycopene isomerase
MQLGQGGLRAQQRPGVRWHPQRRPFAAAAKQQPYPSPDRHIETSAPTDVEYDAVIVGGGMGGLTTAAKLVTKGAKVVVLEK